MQTDQFAYGDLPLVRNAGPSKSAGCYHVFSSPAKPHAHAGPGGHSMAMPPFTWMVCPVT